MCTTKLRNVALAVLVLFSISVQAKDPRQNPRVAIVISETSFELRWGVTQMAAHGWTAAVNLAGLPYHTLFLREVADGRDLSSYDALIFAQCSAASKKLQRRTLEALRSYLAGGGNLIIDGSFLTADAKAREQAHADLDDLLGLVYDGFRGDDTYRIKMTNTRHPISAPYRQGQPVTQHLVSGLNILSFRDSGDTLLVTTNEESAYPFLTVKQTDRNRLVLVSDFSTWSGAASFFRNRHPQVFYANELFNIIVRALQWAVYGDLSTPTPAPQLCNAEMACIIRLDADGSGNLDAQVKTINYLIDVARETGVVPVYGWVASDAAKAGWQDLAPLGERLEAVGGEIGSHSNYHDIDAKMTPKRWREELDEAIHDVEWYMADFGHPIGKVAHFINPGNTIKMSDYDEVGRRFSFYMTHGFEQDMPLGWGNMTWYTDNPAFVVLENCPSPDYQWFYDPEWSYTTAQITAYEEAIFDHMFNTIGKGVLFNQMWHDYSITTQPQRDKERIINASNIAMYDAIAAKFANLPIYAPTPDDLAHKLLTMAQWDYRWQSSDDQVEITLDLNGLHQDTTASYIGGMGLRIDHAAGQIQRVKLDGQDYHAFRDRVIILPNLSRGKHTIEAELGPDAPEEPHLTYVSKPMPSIQRTSQGLELTVMTRSKARFAFTAPEGYLLLNADYQEWRGTGYESLEGYVTSDRRVVLTPTGVAKFRLAYATVQIRGVEELPDGLRLRVAPTESDLSAQIAFASGESPREVLLDGQSIPLLDRQYEVVVNLPDLSRDMNLDLKF